MSTLSIVILSYNTREVTLACIRSIRASLVKHPLNHEIIVVDNGSTDGSVEMLKRQNCLLICNKKNLGFSKGNNLGFRRAKGNYILFLNSDTLVNKVNFSSVIEYLDSHPTVGVLTVRVNLPDGSIDPASHRGFPTLWRSFCYFSKLEKIFGQVPIVSRVFGGYHLTFLDYNTTHEIDSPTGAFYLVRKSCLSKVHGFDESYFMYGEDIDLSYRLKEIGVKLVYFPTYTIIHQKYVSGLQKDDRQTRQKVRNYFYDAMITFYKKHYAQKYPRVLNNLVMYVIDSIKKLS